MKIKEFESQDGRRFIPIFSSIESLQKGIAMEETYLQFDAKTLFEITKGASYILNPYSSYAKEFSPEEVDSLLNNRFIKRCELKIEKNTRFAVGQPKEYPQSLVDALKKYFSMTSVVNKAYLMQIFILDKDVKPHLMVAINMFRQNEKIVQNAITVSQPFMNKDDFVDFMIVNRSDELIKGVKPFFTNTLLNQVKNIFIKSFR